MRLQQGSEAMAGAYGRNLGTKYGADDAPSIVTRSLHATEIAVTEICVHRPPDGCQTLYHSWMRI